MKKKGMTLIELIVAMTLFVVVSTIAVGGFISISRARILIGNMKDSQQKIRIANEMIIRYAREAQAVLIEDSGKTLKLSFDIGTTNPTGKMFKLANQDSGGLYDLLYYECTDSSSTCLNSGTSLLDKTTGLAIADTHTSGTTANDVFSLNSESLSVLELNLVFKNVVSGFASMNDTMTLKNAVIMGELK